MSYDAERDDPDAPLRVLLVEDDVAYAGVVREQLLARLPHAELAVATTLDQARVLLAPAPDVVLADLSLPDGDGLEVVMALRTACPDTAVVVLSRHDGDAYALALIAAGADDCVVKGGHDDAQLAAVVLRAVGRARATTTRQRRERFAASLLDAAQTPTCAVDETGVVLSVNAPWRAFTAANGGDTLVTGVGVDYLAACDDAVGERLDGAAEVAAGLRAVLAGTSDGYELEYPCHAPDVERWCSVRIAPQPEGGGAVISHLDVTGSHVAERARSRQTLHDPVTGLPNAVLLEDRLTQALAEGGRSGHLVAVALVDVEQVRTVRASSGDEAGDALAVEVAGRLEACLRDGDTLAQVGPARFVVVWRDLVLARHADELSDRLVAALAASTTLDEPLACTVGVAVDQWAQTGDELLAAAGAAAHRLRPVLDPARPVDGRPVVTAPAQRTEAALRAAIAAGELVVHYQPVVDLALGCVVGVEALVRWQHPVDGLVPPDAFIPVAESGGLIVALGAQVLETACRQAVAWQSQGLQLDVAVNLSTRQVAHPDLVRTVVRVLRLSGLEPSALVLEVTESAVMEDAEAAATVLSSVAALGVSLSIDDFGTGYSSLVYLKRYPIRSLKVDRSFVGGMGTAERDDAIVASVVGLARAVGGSCIAEGVETVGQYAALVALGCDFGQGWLFGKAVPADELPALVTRIATQMAGLRAALPAGPADRDHAGDRRDSLAARRDSAGTQRDEAADTRDAAADRRDATAEVRDLAAGQRDAAGDTRDALGASRDRAGTRRDEAADTRDAAADARDRAADRRDAAADARDADAERGEAASVSLATADVLRSIVQARRHAADDRERASLDRDAGADERGQAERDRGTALRDRGDSAGERVQAVLDRDTAQADRGAGAGERVQADLDRGTAHADRDAGAGQRDDAERDRTTAGTDRGAAARDRADASLDGLTGSYRRAAGFSEVAREVERAHRTGQPLVAAFVDVDGLKGVNDTLGHAAGDALLVDVATALRGVLRSYDLVVRYGGDEFVCVLPGASLAAADLRADAVHAALAALPGSPSVSIGLALLAPGESSDAVVARADAALYEGRRVRRAAAVG